jgi:hypothetical protein
VRWEIVSLTFLVEKTQGRCTHLVQHVYADRKALFR